MFFFLHSFLTPSGGSDLRIVGGEEAVPHSFPSAVAVFIDDIAFCGGTIVGESEMICLLTISSIYPKEDGKFYCCLAREFH